MKTSTNFYLSPEAKRLIKMIAAAQGISQAAVIEMLIREKAKKLKIKDVSK